MKVVDLLCPKCESSFQLRFEFISNDTGEEVEFTSIECPQCHEYSLGPFGKIENE